MRQTRYLCATGLLTTDEFVYKHKLHAGEILAPMYAVRKHVTTTSAVVCMYISNSAVQSATVISIQNVVKPLKTCKQLAGQDSERYLHMIGAKISAFLAI